jgi:hypothetical protein
VNRTYLAIALWTFSFGAASGEAAFIYSEKKIPGGLEWNKEIVARSIGTIKCDVRSRAAIAVTLIADRSYKAAMGGNPKGMVREDLVLTSDHPNGSFSETIQIDSPGSYWFIVENQSQDEQRIKLTCSKSD